MPRSPPNQLSRVLREQSSGSIKRTKVRWYVCESEVEASCPTIATVAQIKIRKVENGLKVRTRNRLAHKQRIDVATGTLEGR